MQNTLAAKNRPMGRFTLQGIDCRYIESRGKTLRLKVVQDEVRIYAPPWIAHNRVVWFVLNNEAFIRKHLARNAQYQGVVGRTVQEGDFVRVLGVARRIIATPEKGVRLQEGCLWVESGNMTVAVQTWFEKTARTLLQEYFVQTCSQLGMPEIALNIRFLRSKWGSYHRQKNTVTLNAELLQAEPEVIMLVICHELAHRQVPGHGKDFYKVLEGYCPDFRALRKKLNEIVL